MDVQKELWALRAKIDGSRGMFSGRPAEHDVARIKAAAPLQAIHRDVFLRAASIIADALADGAMHVQSRQAFQGEESTVEVRVSVRGVELKMIAKMKGADGVVEAGMNGCGLVATFNGTVDADSLLENVLAVLVTTLQMGC